jgi:hypothetical protein
MYDTKQQATAHDIGHDLRAIQRLAWTQRNNHDHSFQIAVGRRQHEHLSKPQYCTNAPCILLYDFLVATCQ